MLIRCSRHLAVMLVMFTHVLVRHGLQRSSFMAAAALQLHGYRCRQCTAAEKRQPQQHQYGNEFSG